MALAALPATAQPAATPPVQQRPARAEEPTSLTTEQQAKVKAVLAPYNPTSLTADDAKAIKRTLRDAGMRHSRALDKAITAAGFSPERLEALDPRPAQPPPGTPAPGNTPAANGALGKSSLGNAPPRP